MFAVDVVDYWKILRAHWVVLVLSCLIGGGVGLGWAVSQPNVYTSNASGIVSVAGNSDLGAAVAGENFAQSRVNSYVDLAHSRSVAEMVADDLNLEASLDQLLANIEVTLPMDTATLRIAAQASSPEKAQDLAEAWVGALSVAVYELETSGANPDDAEPIVSFQSLDSAQLPTAPSSPNRELAVAIGVLVGGSLGVLYALLKHALDRRVRSAQRAEEETGRAVICSVTTYPGFAAGRYIVTTTGSNDDGVTDPHQYAVGESIRNLRTNLQFMSIDHPPRSIVVTSAVPGEGKSTLVANLAQSIASQGRPVIVIDADMRRPSLAKYFGLLPGVGLTDVLIGEAHLADVLQPYGDTDNLWVLGSGKVPPNPSELLGSETMHELVSELSKEFLVLIDAPPLLPVTDAAIISARADGALVVARAQKTTYDTLNQALGNLDRVGARTLGLIINGVPLKTSDAGQYGYYSASNSLQPSPGRAQPGPTSQEESNGESRS